MLYFIKSNLIGGIKKPRKVLRTLIATAHLRRAGVIIVSYPKTGRTWLRMLIGKALVDTYALPERKVLDTFELTSNPPLKRTVFSHDGPFGLFNSIAAPEDLSYNRRLYRNKDVVFMIRDIRDTLVSSYFQETKRTGQFKGAISDFVRDPKLGARKIVAFYNLWYTHQGLPKSFQLVRYEQLHADPAGELEPVFKTMGADPSLLDLENSIRYGSFSNMRKLEQSKRLASDVLQPASSGDADSFKTRKGEVGGYREYLSEDDLSYIDGIIQADGVAGCDWYKAQAPAPAVSHVAA